jgi:hypothetical protein
LVIHALAGILARYIALPLVLKYTVLSPVAEVNDHSGELSIDIMRVGFLERVIVLRRPMIRPEYEIRGVQKPLGSLGLDAPSSPKMDSARATAIEKIAPIMPEEKVYLPVIIRVPSFRKPNMPSTRFYPRFKVEAHGASSMPRSLFVGCADHITGCKATVKRRLRLFLEALMNRDFEKASEIAGPRYSEEQLENSCYAGAEVISIGEPYLLFKRGYRVGLIVPCQIKLSSGQVTRREILIVTPCYASEEGWFFAEGL